MAVQTNITFDPHTEPHDDVTTGQLTFFTIWIGAGFIWLLRFLQSGKSSPGQGTDSSNDGNQKLLNGIQANANGVSKNKLDETVVKIENGGTKTETPNKTAAHNFSKVRPPPTIDEFLQSLIIFGIIMIYFYLCEYRKVSGSLINYYSQE